MTTNHLLYGFIFGISISINSWIVGMILNYFLMKTEYFKKLSNLNFIKSKKINQRIGINSFRWIVKNTFFSFFNQKIKLKNQNVDFSEIRNEMTIAEISHLIGFIFVTIFAIYKSFSVSLIFGLTIMISNVFLNLYPSLLQQENQRRIDKLITKQKR